MVIWLLGSKKHRKAIHFDLDEIKLKAAYPYHDENHNPNNYKNTYGMIERELYKLGFDHRQYSGYISRKALTDMEMSIVIKKLAQKFYWLKGCFQRLDTENVSKNHDYVGYFDEAAEMEQQRRNMSETVQNTVQKTKDIVQQVVIHIQNKFSKGHERN